MNTSYYIGQINGNISTVTFESGTYKDHREITPALAYHASELQSLLQTAIDRNSAVEGADWWASVITVMNKIKGEA